MTEQRFGDELSPGDELPPMVKNATTTQLFLFSGATWNPHRIHYDRAYAAEEGHPDLLVHGPLQGAWLSQFVADWAGQRGRVLRLEWQNRARAFPGQDLTFRGRVTSVERAGDAGGAGGAGDGWRVELALSEENPDGQVLMPGTATVLLPGR